MNKKVVPIIYPFLVRQLSCDQPHQSIEIGEVFDLDVVESSDADTGLSIQQCLIKELIQGTTTINKRDIYLTIKDPNTAQVVARLKNPKVPISLPSKFKRVIDLDW